MISVYINYPNKVFSLAHDVSAAERWRHPDSKHRVEPVNFDTLGSFISKLQSGDIKFLPQADFNDLYIEVDFGEDEFDLQVVLYIKRVLGARYKPFRDAEVREAN